jgi:hypothetical protein
MVDGTELLVALPGHVHLIYGVVGIEARADLGLLALGEMFHPVAEEPADLIQRVVLVTAPAKGVLLHASPEFIDHLGT